MSPSEILKQASDIMGWNLSPILCAAIQKQKMRIFVENIDACRQIMAAYARKGQQDESK